VTQVLPKGEAGTLEVRVPLRRGETFFLRVGDLLPRLCLLLVSWGVLLAWLGRERRAA
jgi:apolipoprotein N-acyltransferase